MNAMQFKEVAKKRLMMYKRGFHNSQQVYLYMLGVIDTLEALELYTSEHDTVYSQFTSYLLGTPEAVSKAKKFFFNNN